MHVNARRILDTFICLCLLIFMSNCPIAVKSQTCSSFRNIFVQFKDVKGDSFNQTIDGCIERIKFDGKKSVTEALIRKQNDLIRLGRDSVRNMMRLSRISIVGCNYLEIIEAGCFRNVPDLRKVQITFCKIRNIPKDIFSAIPKLEILRLNNNLLESIEDQAFGNLSTLKRIFLGYNNIQTWRKQWFTNSINIELLDFQSNSITVIPANAFDSFKLLKEINFRNNKLETIEPEAFKGIQRLQIVDLSYNRLKVINENVFPSLLEIGALMVNQNKLNFIADNCLRKIKVRKINLHYNPWECRCLEKIYQWIRFNNATLDKTDNCYEENIPECAVSENKPDNCEESIDEDLTERYFDSLDHIPRYLERCDNVSLEDEVLVN